MQKIILLLIFCFFSLACTPQDGLARDSKELEKIKLFYNNINTFSADIEQTLKHKETGNLEKRNGKIKFLKPAFIYWNTFKPNEEFLICEKNAIWDYFPDEQIVYKYPTHLLNNTHGILQIITGADALDKNFKIVSSKIDGKYMNFTLLPKEPTTQLVEANIWVDPDKGIITKGIITDFYGNTNEITLKNFKTDIRLSAKDFNFNPPKNVDIEDKTK